MSDCDCHPGTDLNGWHETRGPNCAQKDRDTWTQFIQRRREHLVQIRAGTHPVTVLTGIENLDRLGGVPHD